MKLYCYFFSENYYPSGARDIQFISKEKLSWEGIRKRLSKETASDVIKDYGSLDLLIIDTESLEWTIE